MRNDDEGNRPSPEALLKLAQAEEKKDEGRGKLKIFLGYAAGVGKTFAMLEEAWQRRLEERDVVAAYVESHGRFETDSLLSGLEMLPKAQIEYMGVTLPELDLDAVLARKPHIALVDELAHTNAPGCRHQKRWQDVEEILTAGIDVYTTVNIQHFESLNDTVAQITGVVVRETVPDSIIDMAAEIRLVDIPPEDLLQRLNEGKIYIPQQATMAMEKFFKPGNLMALRELSMRRAAERVDDQMRAYMESRSIAGPWATAERLLVCVSGSPFSERLIRVTRRLADEMKSPWHTVYIETPGGGKHARENRGRVWRDIRLAETLGAQVATMTATSVAQAAIEYAFKNNITKIVVGKPAKPRWREFLRTPLVDQIIRLSGTIDVYVVSLGEEKKKPEPEVTRPKRGMPWPELGKSLVLVLAATGVSELVSHFLSPTNLVMIYLLAVVLAATRLGRKPAILTAFLSVLAFDFFFIPPKITFTVYDTEYLITFVALFIVGVVISTLVSQSRERAEAIRTREVQTASLYYLSRDLAAAADVEGILGAVIKNVEGSLEALLAVLLPEGDRLDTKSASNGFVLDTKELAVADWTFRNGLPAGRGTDTLISAGVLYLPLKAGGSTLGVLAVKLKDEVEYSSPDTRRLLNAFVSQTALAIERVRLVKQAEQSQILQARDSLERALLNSISHDLRTPLVSITGTLDTLWENGSELPEKTRKDLLDAARGEAQRLNRFVGNLLDMTRLEAGGIRLKKQPSDVQDLFGCALAPFDKRAVTPKITVNVPADLPPVSMDMALMTQVLVNLLDNAVKHSPSGTLIECAAGIDDGKIAMTVSDSGHGVPEGDLHRIFDKFYRVPVPEGAGGTGLGLAICKGIVEAHGGEIRAENRVGGGLRVTVTLPLGETETERAAE